MKPMLTSPQAPSGTAEAGPSIGPAGASPIDLAELLLALMLRPGVTGVTLRPSQDGHLGQADVRGERTDVLLLPGDLGDAVVARLACLGRIDLVAPVERIGRLRVREGRRAAELMLAVGAGQSGLSVTLRRLLEGADAAGYVVDDPRAGVDVGPYRLEDEIGRGGVGIVYRARHRDLGVEVAIKFLRRDLARDADLAARFLQEGQVASRLRSDGLVRVHDYGITEGGWAHLVMDLCTWPTLRHILDLGPLPARRALRIAAGIARALGAAHAAGVVHRDIKPGNVFVGPDDVVKVGDFGAAKLVGMETIKAGPDTALGVVSGTAQYMSPEHARGRSTDARTDVYALGAVLWEMLTGEVPFDGEGMADVLAKQIGSPLPVLVSPFPGTPFPSALVEAVTRMLAKKPEARTPSAADALMDIDRALCALDRTGWRRLIT